MKSMVKIVAKRSLNAARTTTEMVFEAPLVSRKCLPGQFVILRLNQYGERFPLTVADYDRARRTVTVIYQVVGASTRMLDMLEPGEEIQDFAGPLGLPTAMEGLKRVAVVGGGVGCAIAAPVARGMSKNGIDVDMIVGFRSRDIVILEDEMLKVCAHLYIMTDDGSYGGHGFTTDKLRALLESGERYDQVTAIGPPLMMKLVCDLTKPYGIKTVVSLNPIMIDGTGMCGCCRVTVGGKRRFACVEGPEFDGHAVDWDELIARNRIYIEEERAADEHVCKIGLGGMQHA